MIDGAFSGGHARNNGNARDTGNTGVFRTGETFLIAHFAASQDRGRRGRGVLVAPSGRECVQVRGVIGHRESFGVGARRVELLVGLTRRTF